MQIITGTCKVYIFDSVDRCRMVDMILKRGVKPVAAGMGDKSPYLLFTVEEVVPLIDEWRIRKLNDEEEKLREY